VDGHEFAGDVAVFGAAAGERRHQDAVGEQQGAGLQRLEEGGHESELLDRVNQ